MHSLGLRNDLMEFAREFVDLAQSIPAGSRDEMRLRVAIETVAGAGALSSRQKADAAHTLYRIFTECPWGEYNQYLARGIIDSDRFFPSALEIMAWDAEQNRFCTVIDRVHRGVMLSLSDDHAIAVACALVADLIPEGVSASYDPDNPPYYERPLESFSDEIITTVWQSREGHWYASLDAGPDFRGSVDYARCASTPEAAIALCARSIRLSAPRRFTSSEINFTLKKHWAGKEGVAVEA